MFGQILALVLLYGLGGHGRPDVVVAEEMAQVFLFLYSLVLISNLADGIWNRLQMKPFRFSWNLVQSEHWLIFVVSLVIAIKNPGELGFISFVVVFLFIYLTALLLVKAMRLRCW
jgi:hypothetical protein